MNIELDQVQKMLEWLKTKLYLSCTYTKANSRLVKRGQVYRCNFGRGIGSEIQKERPAVILQNALGNIHSGNTIVAPITHDNSKLPCAVNLTTQKNDAGSIVLDGQVNVSNIMCISKARLGDYICTLSSSDMKLIDVALAKTFDIMKYYSDLLHKLDDKISYINRLKSERNNAQDKLLEIQTLLNLNDSDEIIYTIKKLKYMVDTTLNNE